MTKYKLNTDMFSGFKLNETLYPHNNGEQYGKEFAQPGDNCIGIGVIKALPEFFEEIICDTSFDLPKNDKTNQEKFEKALEDFHKQPWQFVPAEPKITLRDHFAGLAMQALISHDDFLNNSYFTHAGEAYKIADEMVKESRLNKDK